MSELTIQHPRRWFSQDKRRALAGMLFVVPSLILFLAFLGLPVFYSLYISFHEWSLMGSPTWLGLENYRGVFGDDIFLNALGNTAFYTVLFVPGVTVLSLLTAVLVNERVRGQSIYKALVFIPVITPSIIVGVVWIYLFQPERGLVNQTLASVGLPTSLWLGSQVVALPALVIVSIWQRFGWFMILFLAGLQDIPTEIKEAAAVDGASPRQSFFHITLPLLRPTVLLVTVLAAISAFQVFDLVFVMTQGGPARATETLSYYIYTRAFRSFDLGYAAAMSYVLFVLLLVMTLIQFRLMRPATDS
jgi:multiple sugar transport system permease protein